LIRFGVLDLLLSESTGGPFTEVDFKFTVRVQAHRKFLVSDRLEQYFLIFCFLPLLARILLQILSPPVFHFLKTFLLPFSTQTLRFSSFLSSFSFRFLGFSEFCLLLLGLAKAISDIARLNFWLLLSTLTNNQTSKLKKD